MGGVNLATLAWRNLWRNRRRTIITLSGYAFGVMLAVIFIGLGDDSYGKMIDMAARNGAGHVTIQHAEYLDTPSLKKTVDDVTRLRARAQEAEEVVTVTTRITGPAMLATARKSYGAFFVALDPAQETPETFGLLSSLREGALFTGADDEGVILGATLAENLHAGLGRKVVYTMTDKSGEMTSGMARVSGIIETGDDGLDAAFFMLPLGRARAQLGYGADEAGQIAVFVGEQRGSEAIAAALQRSLDELGSPAVALPWTQTQPEIASFVAIDEGGNLFFQFVIMLLLAAGIFNSLFVSVMERLREFGIMLAVGFRPAQIFGLVMWESLWLALVGLAAAGLITAGPYYYLSTAGVDMSGMVGDGYNISGVTLSPVMYVNIYPEKLIYIAVIVIVVTLLAGLYPAWKAGRVAPVESIKLV